MQTAMRSRIATAAFVRLLFAMMLQAAIDGVRHLPQRQFAQGNQVCLAEKIVQRPVHTFLRIDIAAPHAVLQRLRRQIGHHDFVDSLQHPVGNRFPHLNSRDALHRRRDALEVLNVHGGEHVDAGVEQFEHIFIALAMLAAFDVGVRQFVDQSDLRLARQDGVHIHLFEQRALVFDLLARNDFQVRHQFGDAFAAVGFHHADDNVFAAAVAADGFAQHVVGLADARRVSEEEFEDASLSSPGRLPPAIARESWASRLLSLRPPHLSMSDTIGS